VKATGPGWDWEWKLRERDGSGIDHCGTGTGTGMTAAGMGRDREQRTSPMQNSTLHCVMSVTFCVCTLHWLLSYLCVVLCADASGSHFVSVGGRLSELVNKDFVIDIELERIPLVHRATTVFSDLRAANFAVLQAHPNSWCVCFTMCFFVVAFLPSLEFIISLPHKRT